MGTEVKGGRRDGETGREVTVQWRKRGRGIRGRATVDTDVVIVFVSV